MKLRPDEYNWILSEGDAIPENAPKEIKDKIEQYQKAYYNSDIITIGKYWQSIKELYSYITIINIHYEIIDIDLKKGYIEYKAIIKIKEKYYSFIYRDSLYNMCDYDANQELREVKPTNVVVTKYI